MTTPWKDPIVDETRSRGQQLATEAGDDMHTFFENMPRAQERYAARVVHRIESARAAASMS
jgi:hypothetical protein